MIKVFEFLYGSSPHSAAEVKSLQSAPTTLRYSSSLVCKTSQFFFLIFFLPIVINPSHAEEYLTTKGYNGVNTTQMSDWRRDHMSNLVNAFDFENVSYLSCFQTQRKSCINISKSPTTPSLSSRNPHLQSPTLPAR
jgi:hypothetical protein